MNYEKELQFATDLARQAGKVMSQYFQSVESQTEWKEDHTPLTVADTTINELVIKKVQESYPEHGVLGEEDSFKPDREMIWVVDPIDGTAPFSLGIPVSTFSLALVDRSDGQPLVGVTYDPFLDEMYTASKGSGAFLNEKPIHVSGKTDFVRSYLSLSSRGLEGDGFSYRPSHIMEELRDKGAKMLSFVSFVYTSNRVASGQFLSTVVGETNPWDIAACALLVQEAGGIVTDFHGEKRRFDEVADGCLMSANKTIHEQMLKRIQT